MLIMWLIAPFPWRIWFIRLLLTLLTYAHLLHAYLFHLTHVLPGAHRLQSKASRCPHNRGVSCSGNDAPVCCICDTLLCFVRFARLESWNSRGFRGLDSFLSSILESAFILSSIDIPVMSWIFHPTSSSILTSTYCHSFTDFIFLLPLDLSLRLKKFCAS